MPTLLSVLYQQAGGDTVIVIDGKIKGKARPRFSTKTGRAYTTADTISYEHWVKFCYKEQSNVYLQGPIRARIEVYYSIPKSYTKKRRLEIKEGRERATKKPDIDNITKIILDALNKIAFDDDSQVVELTVIKRYTEENERVEFELEEIKDE